MNRVLHDRALARSLAMALPQPNRQVRRQFRALGTRTHPGLQLRNWFGSAAADQAYGQNWARVRSPVVDSLIDSIIGEDGGRPVCGDARPGPRPAVELSTSSRWDRSPGSGVGERIEALVDEGGLLRRTARAARALARRGAAMLFECADIETRARITDDRTVGRLCLPAGERQLAVPESSMRTSEVRAEPK